MSKTVIAVTVDWGNQPHCLLLPVGPGRRRQAACNQPASPNVQPGVTRYRLAHKAHLACEQCRGILHRILSARCIIEEADLFSPTQAGERIPSNGGPYVDPGKSSNQ